MLQTLVKCFNFWYSDPNPVADDPNSGSVVLYPLHVCSLLIIGLLTLGL